MTAEGKVIYLVRWRRELCYLRKTWAGAERVPGRRIVRAFADRAAAQRHVDDLHQGRAPSPPEANPFLSFDEGYDGHDAGDLEGLTEMPEPVFLDLIRDLGLEPPPEKELKTRRSGTVAARDWAGWWRESAAKLGEAGRGRVWRALDWLSFYEVVEAPFPEPEEARAP
jgi:hypothetical protein